MDIILLLGGFLLSLALVLKTSEKIGEIAERLFTSKKDELSFGFAVLGTITAFPELALAASAIVLQNTEMIIGNALGNIMADLTFCIGLIAIFFGIKFGKHKLFFERLLIVFVVCFILLLGTRFPPKFLAVIFFVSYVFLLKTIWKPSLYLQISFTEMKRTIVWIVLLAISSVACVYVAKEIVSIYKLSTTLFGASIITAVTLIPVISVSFQLIRKNMQLAAIANLFGSAIFDLLFILSVLLFFTSILPVPEIEFLTTFLLISVGFLYLVLSKDEITAYDGIGLIMIFILYFLSTSLGLVIL